MFEYVELLLGILKSVGFRILYPLLQGTRERKKSAGDSSVVPDDGPGSSSVQISDAVPCVEEVISTENEVMNQLRRLQAAILYPLLQGTRERKKSAGDSSVVPDDGPGSSSVQISDAVPCVEEVISTENEVMNQLHGNTFECLAQSEEEETAIALVSSRFEPNNNSEFSDNSPIIDTFKHINKVDELDFTPVPISRKKLKKLKNRILANMQDPVVRGHTQPPNG